MSFIFCVFFIFTFTIFYNFSFRKKGENEKRRERKSEREEEKRERGDSKSVCRRWREGGEREIERDKRRGEETSLATATTETS